MLLCVEFPFYIHGYIYIYTCKNNQKDCRVVSITMVIWHVVKIKQTPAWRLNLLVAVCWKCFYGMILFLFFFWSNVKSPQMSPERILKSGYARKTLICRKLRESVTAVGTEGVSVCVFFGLTLICLWTD